MNHSEGSFVKVSEKYEAPAHVDLRNRDYCRWVEFLRESDGWNRQHIEDYQLEQVRQAVKFAYENTRGYKALYDKFGVSPDTIQTIDDLRKLPFIEKQMIRDNLEDFSANIDGRYYVTTGGSTGVPCGMYRDQKSFAKELASKAHQYYRVGWKEGDRQFVLRGLQIATGDRMELVPDFNELRCSTYHFTSESMEIYRQRALTYEPEWIRCYPSSGYVFARFLKETNRSFPKIKGILCASEHLYDFQKKLFSEIFDARVFCHYGHYEMAVLAGFCEYEDTYHVLPQYGYAELIGEDGKPVVEPGHIGEIVGTSFIMKATPFVRYKTQDLAVLKGFGCSSCGRPYQIWERIEGRLQELIVTGKGRYVSTSMLNMHDDFYDHIKHFQFYQKEQGKVVFRFVPKQTCNRQVVEDMKRALLLKMGADVELTMESVGEIALTKRGKHRLLVQEMENEYNDLSLGLALRL